MFSHLFLGVLSPALDRAFPGARYIACPHCVLLRCRIPFYLLSVGDFSDGILEMNILPNQTLDRMTRSAVGRRFQCERPWRAPRHLRTMRTPATCLAVTLLFTGCSRPSPPSSQAAAVTLPPRLDSYFESYCDYTGGLGIGFDASHTYDYRFRQHLKTTHDPELKRLFVLQHLQRDVEFALDDFEKGIVRTGKTSSRPLSLSEWQDAQRNIQTQIDDLATYYTFTNFATVMRDPFDPPDPNMDSMWIDELREKLRNVTNAPAANEQR
jgi:hypothetical protein